MRWAILGTAAAAFVYLLYSGGVAVLSALSTDAPGSSARSEAPGLAVAAASAPVPQRPAELPSNVPPPAAVRSMPENAAIAVSSVASPGQISRPSQGLGRILRRQLVAGLAAFRSPLASCPDSQSRGGFGGGDEESDRASRPAVLMLEVARLDGRMEIVDVPREKRRRATEAFMACARNVLRGRVIDVPAARAGGRMHIAFHLGNEVSQVAE